MKGLVLAAGRGSRLGALTATLPKTLLPLSPGVTILDLIVNNLRSAGVTEIAIVVGFAAGAIETHLPEIERAHDVSLTLINNDRAETWNNAYSMWLATDWMDQDTIMVNGDTVHPASVEASLLAAAGSDDRDVLVAMDDRKALGVEEMKVVLTPDGSISRINKGLAPAEAAGEYIGVSLIRSRGVAALRQALAASWQASPDRYYEDGYQEFADQGHRIGAIPVGVVAWVEVDTPDDLERAREIACRY